MKIDKELMDLYRSTASKEASGTENRKAFAAALAPVILAEVECESTARQILAVDPIARGAEARYPLDTPTLDAIRMPVHGAVPEQYIAHGEVFVNTYEIATSAHWKLQHARDARFNILQRQIFKLKNAIVKKENTDAWALVRAAIAAGTTVGGASGFTSLDLASFNTAVAELESNEGRTPNLLVVSPRRAADFRGWASTTMTPETFKDVQDNAKLGNLWGIDIVKSWDLADTEAYLFDTTKFGVMPEKYQLELFEDPAAIGNLEVRYIGAEEVGMGVLDKLAVIKLVFAS